MRLIGAGFILLAIQVSLTGYTFARIGRLDQACQYMTMYSVIYGLPLMMLGIGWELLTRPSRVKTASTDQTVKPSRTSSGEAA